MKAAVSEKNLSDTAAFSSNRKICCVDRNNAENKEKVRIMEKA